MKRNSKFRENTRKSFRNMILGSPSANYGLFSNISKSATKSTFSGSFSRISCKSRFWTSKDSKIQKQRLVGCNFKHKKNWNSKIFPNRKNRLILKLGTFPKFLPSYFTSLIEQMVEIMSFSKILKCPKNHGCFRTIIGTLIICILQTISYPTVCQTFKSDFYSRMYDQK